MIGTLFMKSGNH